MASQELVKAERTRYPTIPTQNRRRSEIVAEKEQSLEKKKVEEVEEKSGGLRRCS
jgi:hypothetical protein